MFFAVYLEFQCDCCIEQVRGWMYTSQTLSVEQQEHAFGQICEKFDLCRSCGSDSHFASCCHCLTKAAWFAKGR